MTDLDELERLRLENEALRAENARLKRELDAQPGPEFIPDAFWQSEQQLTFSL